MGFWSEPALPAACPHCGNPFIIPAGTFTLIRSGALLRCNLSKCRATFTAYKLPKAKEIRYLDEKNQSLAAWRGPPLFPDQAATKDSGIRGA